MARLIGVAGSLREGSFNGALLRAAAAAVPAGTTLTVGSLRGIPLYDGDLEARDGIPASVTALKDLIAAADGLVLVSPEYNQSIPGVMKNALDWASRPAADMARVFAGKPVALLGASPGAGGTRMAQTAWLPVFRALGLVPWFGRQLYVGGAAQAFGPDGALVDEKVKSLLADFLRDFAAFVDRAR